MSRRIVCALALVCGLAMLVGCRRARQYPAYGIAVEPGKPKTVAQPKLGWSDEQPTSDVPIKFVATNSPRWNKLNEEFWNPPSVAGAPTAHLGQWPLSAVVALLPQFQPAVHIKVPLGLPDPNPHIPKTNPPTLGSWQLGKELFEKRMIYIDGSFRSCKDCHLPPHSPETKFDPPSLINCVYNRRQFWDGRVAHLEETLVRSLDDEVGKSDSRQLREHAWHGLATRLGKYPEFVRKFRRVFGIPRPTLNTAAKALATYMRTMLSGNSVYDRANQARIKRKGTSLKPEDFMQVLDSGSPARFKNDKLSVKELADKLALGWNVFHGKGGCARCHPGPLFTDHDFHNLGIGASIATSSADPVGRYAHLPIGLKAKRYMGAYRTPPLRALPRTGPYMHDGSIANLLNVIEYYNTKMEFTTNLYLDPLFLAGRDKVRRLNLTSDEQGGLYFFLQSLDGEPISPKIVGK